ncbi:hypothetical protein THAOC_18440 [Thalassiosira oceanica]|uniref:Uncharacterized protein n=1 Tax=Thalassiosira oceanica TaxID=159749 RepID=K0SJG6_THAOC|nr:hypothetical protein THAOC_18440 [Thalassiosira oceanica]|eukprot:EJK61121.1 hypothetical protein THAOC_18440 [Thalassiosira oceanica]
MYRAAQKRQRDADESELYPGGGDGVRVRHSPEEALVDDGNERHEDPVRGDREADGADVSDPPRQSGRWFVEVVADPGRVCVFLLDPRLTNEGLKEILLLPQFLSKVRGDVAKPMLPLNLLYLNSIVATPPLALAYSRSNFSFETCVRRASSSSFGRWIPAHSSSLELNGQQQRRGRPDAGAQQSLPMASLAPSVLSA